MKVVKITLANMLELAPLCSEWYQENRSHIPITEIDGAKQIYDWVKDDATFGIFALYDETKKEPYVGFLACQIARYPFWSGKIVGELGWFVRNSARGFGKLLIDEMERFGKAKGAIASTANIYLGAGSDSGAAATRSLQKLGYNEFERVFMKPI